MAIWRNVSVQIADRREERRHPSAEAIHPPPQILTGRLVAPDEVGHVIEENWIRIVEGVAADGVARVGAVDTSGTIVAEAPVEDNVYKFTTTPTNALTGLAALDATGRVVYRLSWSG